MSGVVINATVIFLDVVMNSTKHTFLWIPLAYLLVHILAQPEHPFWINLNTYSETS
jgi:hypothetical protein